MAYVVKGICTTDSDANGLIDVDVGALNRLAERVELAELWEERALTIGKAHEQIVRFDSGLLTPAASGDDLRVARLGLTLAEE